MEQALAIIRELNQRGYEAFLVGGCVRDMLLSRTPQDWDITTNALPEEIKAVFPKTIDTGIRHGTVTVISGGSAFEVTTYRKDGEYENFRRPKSIKFVKSLREDLARRDFTINAMAYHPDKGFIDYFGGREDLEKKIIQTVGKSEERFLEDALRILRAARFSAQLGFSLSEETKEGMEKTTHLLRKISAERIRDELSKMLVSPHPEIIYTLYKMRILKEILPTVCPLFETEQNTPYHIFNVGEHTIEVLKNTPPVLTVRLAALLHDLGKPLCRETDEKGVDHFKGHSQKSEEMGREILKKLKFDNKTTSKVLTLIIWHDERFPAEEEAVRFAVSRVGKAAFRELIFLKEADAKGQNPAFLEQNMENLHLITKHYEKIINENHPLLISDLEIDGSDLLEAGVMQGEEVGRVLMWLLDEVLKAPDKNKRDILLQMAKNKLMGKAGLEK